MARPMKQTLMKQKRRTIVFSESTERPEGLGAGGPGDDHDHDMDQGPPEPPMVVSPVS